MSKEDPGTSEVVVIHHPSGIKHGCKYCGKIHLQGEYAVGLIVKEDGHEFRYAIGFETPIWCCGKEKPFFQVFTERKEAAALCAEVVQHLNEHRATTGLKLIGFRLAETGAPESSDGVGSVH
ncbi:MAG TPA: hypothetical protein VFA15_05990 [Nitrososphaera sp.]|nr:hypothetical protein [Nitrososphaera sp.]